jgi:hypothetical protein
VLEAGPLVGGELGAAVGRGVVEAVVGAVVGALVAPVVGAAAADDGLVEPRDVGSVARGPAASSRPDLPTP